MARQRSGRGNRRLTLRGDSQMVASRTRVPAAAFVGGIRSGALARAGDKTAARGFPTFAHYRTRNLLTPVIPT